MKIRRLTKFLSRSLAIAVWTTTIGVAATTWGQTGGGNTGGGNFGGGNTGGGNIGGGNTGGGNFGGTGATGNLGGQTGTTNGTTTGTTTNTGGQTGGASVSGGNNPLNLAQNSQLNIAPETTNLFPDVVRSEGFVGPTASAMSERGFVGGASAQMPTPNAAGFVGGVNSSTGTGTGTGAARGGAQAAGRGAAAGGQAGGFGQNSLGALGGMGNTNGGEIQRRGVRARVSSRINVQLPSSEQVQDRFVSKMSRLPAVDRSSDGVQIRIENKTATLTGESSRAEVDALIRQLRLEPGVYRVVDQVQIRQ